jgi:hypothetical protein
MKHTIKIIVLMSALSMIAGCNDKKKCDDYPPIDIRESELRFSVIDKEGRDLFFGKDSVYDPHNVKIINEQGGASTGWMFVDKQRECFKLLFFPMIRANFLYIEFIPDRIDTMKIESRKMGVFEFPKGCPRYEIFEYDFFFNDSVICTTCACGYSDDKIYKIELK